MRIANVAGRLTIVTPVRRHRRRARERRPFPGRSRPPSTTAGPTSRRGRPISKRRRRHGDRPGIPRRSRRRGRPRFSPSASTTARTRSRRATTSPRCRSPSRSSRPASPAHTVTCRYPATPSTGRSNWSRWSAGGRATSPPTTPGPTSPASRSARTTPSAGCRPSASLRSSASASRSRASARPARGWSRLDEFDDVDDLALDCTVNGELMQSGRTRDMIVSVPGIISRLSAVCPLLPGDLIFTGTPEGVGSGRTPPIYLRPGDEVVSTIEHIGAIRQRCVAAAHAMV